MAAKLDQNDDRRKRVFVGTLPEDFLRVGNNVGEATRSGSRLQDQQEAADAQAAMALQQQLGGMPAGIAAPNPADGWLTLSLIQARLVKNYGMTRMDPYVRIRVDRAIYETPTDTNGGRNPKWNRDIQCILRQGVSTINVEIWDECSFTEDELIAWTQIVIPPNVLKGEPLDDWFLLTGKQGKGLEGSINMILSYTPMGAAAAAGYGYYPTVAPMARVIPIGGTYGLSPYAPAQVAYAAMPPMAPATAPPPPQPNPEDIRQMEEMFPNADKEVIRSIYESYRYRKDLAVNCLLQMV